MLYIEVVYYSQNSVGPSAGFGSISRRDNPKSFRDSLGFFKIAFVVIPLAITSLVDQLVKQQQSRGFGLRLLA